MATPPGYPPQGGPGYPQGQPYGGQPSYGAPQAPQQPYGAPQQPYGAPGQQAYGAPGQQPYGAPQQAPYAAPTQPPFAGQNQGFAPAGYVPPPRPTGRNRLVGILGAIGIIIVVIAIKALILGGLSFGTNHERGANQKPIADVGDCVEKSGLNDIVKVDCTDPGAQYKVAGKVDGKSKTDFDLNSDKICAPWHTTSAFWRGTTGFGGTGYVLCLTSVSGGSTPGGAGNSSPNGTTAG